MRYINNILTSPTHSFYHVDDSGYFRFDINERKFSLDVNSLDLLEGDRQDLPAPSTIVPQYPMMPNRYVRAVVLEMTHACQLRCDYCYVSHYYGEMASKMTTATAIQAIEKLLEPKVVTRYGATVSFFGGEALLNFEVIQDVVRYIRSRYGAQVGFGITSNCCNLTPEKADFLAENRFSLVASVDGPADIHDVHRKTIDGTGTHDEVLRGLSLLRTAGVTKVSLRSTFLPDCTRLLERTKYLNGLCDEGLGRNVSVEPAFLSETACIKPSPEHQFTLEGVKELMTEYVEVGDYLTERLKDGQPARFKNIMTFAERLLYHRHQVTECGAGVGMAAVAPNGAIFGCFREMHSKIGELDRGGIDERQRAPWMDNRCLTNTDCQVCACRNVCGGPCREHSIGTMKDIRRSDPVACEFKRNWIKVAAKILADLPATEIVSMIPNKAAKRKQLTTKTRKVNFVREAGGFGDIISMGGAAKQLHLEDPEAHITACVPNEFVEIAEHLEGFDGIMGLGPLEYLAEHRRPRCVEPNPAEHPYLGTLPPGTLVDLWCPAVAYEMRSKARLELTRSQIFALEANCAGTESALPRWKVTPGERKFAIDALEGCSATGPVVALCPRGTKSQKNISKELMGKILEFLLGCDCTIIYIDCLRPEGMPDRVKWFQTDFSNSVALVEQCDIVMTVDTSFFHVGAALGMPVLGLFSVTDGDPYRALYPNTRTIQVDGPMAHCAIPCNWSKDKGYSEKCHETCLRMGHVTIEMLRKPFMELVKLSNSDDFQQGRLARMLEK